MPHPPRRLVAGVALVLSGSLAGVGCAGGDPDASVVSASVSATAVLDPAALVTNGINEGTADEAISRARDALLAASSFRVAGSPSRGAPLDLVYSSEEDLVGSQGTVTQSESTFELLAVNADIYVRGNLDWLAEAIAEEAPRTLGESWLLLPAAAGADLAVFADPQLLVDSLLVPQGPVRSVGVSLIDGQPALGVQYVDSEATVWVAGDGEPYPVLVERLGATATDGVLRLTAFNADVELAPPPADQVVIVDDAVE